MTPLILYWCHSGVTVIDSDVLKDFEWHRDRKGYRLTRDPDLIGLHGRVPPRTSLIGLIIVPNGAHSDSIKYRPFAGGGDLWKAFASVKSPEELVRFVNDHGPLRTDHSPSPPNPKMLVFRGESVRSILDCAKMFRELLLLKAQGDPRKLASYFESNRSADLRFDGVIGRVELVGDPSTGLRLKMRPPNLLGALWCQLGLKLSNATLRTCRACGKVFEVGAGTRLRADAEFCCRAHKVEYFNRHRPRATKNLKDNRR
jgi:hypothetical protein